MFNTISPWLVGSMKYDSDIESYGEDFQIENCCTKIILAKGRLREDMRVTKSRGQQYFPVVWPGFTWGNLNKQA